MLRSPLVTINMALLLFVRVFGTTLRRVMYIALPSDVPHPPGFFMVPMLLITFSEGKAKFRTVLGLLLYETAETRTSPRLRMRI